MTREEKKFPWSMQETIENLKDLKVILQEQLKKKNYEGQGDRDVKEIALDFDRAIESLEKQIPKKPKHIHEEYEKHQWEKDENGNVDEWAYTSEFHNGVVCERCHEIKCVHCNPDYDEEPCIVNKDVCPVCGKTVYRYDKEKYCSDCGQALDWTEEGES